MLFYLNGQTFSQCSITTSASCITIDNQKYVPIILLNTVYYSHYTILDKDASATRSLVFLVYFSLENSFQNKAICWLVVKLKEINSILDQDLNPSL